METAFCLTESPFRSPTLLSPPLSLHVVYCASDILNFLNFQLITRALVDCTKTTGIDL